MILLDLINDRPFIWLKIPNRKKITQESIGQKLQNADAWLKKGTYIILQYARYLFFFQRYLGTLKSKLKMNLEVTVDGYSRYYHLPQLIGRWARISTDLSYLPSKCWNNFWSDGYNLILSCKPVHRWTTCSSNLNSSDGCTLEPYCTLITTVDHWSGS